MLRAKLSVVCAWSMAGAALLLSGCSSTPEDKAANWSPNKIYAEAKDELNSGSYDKAVTLFEKLEGRAAGTPLAQQAQLDKAYAQYKSCLLYTSDAADDLTRVDLGGRRILKK